MNFLRGVSALIPNENTRNVLEAVSSQVQNFMANKGEAKEEKIERISESRLRRMLKLDNLTLFSCHSESTANGPIFHAIYHHESKSVCRSNDERAVRELCKKLNPLDDVKKDPTRLETLMAVVNKEPDWADVHYAVACGFLNNLLARIQKDPELILNYATADGRFPLNIAAELGQMGALKLLLNAGAALDQLDSRGRTVVHWAAAGNADVLQELSSSPSFQKCLLLPDGDGMSPLACAIRASNFETVQLLMGLSAPLGPLESGPLLMGLVGLKYSDSLARILELITTVSPSVVEQTDSYQRAVFHKKLDPQVLSALLRKSYKYMNLNLPDKLGNTALHMAVDRDDLDSVVVLLTHGADIDAVNGGGETALMRAVTGGFILIVKCLLVFGASLEIKNKQGMDVFAVSASSKKRADVEVLLKIQKNGAGVPPAKVNEIEDFSQKLALEWQSEEGKKKPIMALSLDGGGIRGLVLIQILLEIEEQLGRPVMSSFSWLAGTSTGAILALALAQGKTPLHCRNLYFQLKDLVFTGNRPFSATALENLLKEEYGEATTMKSIGEGKRVMVTTCKANVSPPELNLVRSYHDQQGGTSPFDDPTKVPAWLAARCSSAAPTYFPSVKETWMDGGLIANNPCCELLTDIHTFNTVCRMKGSPAPPVGCVLSIGTGKAPITAAETIDLDMPDGFNVGAVIRNLSSILHLKSVLIEQVACADGAAVSRARAWAHSLPAPFFRFSPQLTENVDLAETKNTTLIEMLWQTKVYMRSEAYSVQQLIGCLKKLGE